MKQSDFKHIVKESMREAFYTKKAKSSLNEEVFGKRLTIQLLGEEFDGVLSKNTKPNELPYRISWFKMIGTKYLAADGHIDLDEEEVKYVLENKNLPQSAYDRYEMTPERFRIVKINEMILNEELEGFKGKIVIKDKRLPRQYSSVISKNTKPNELPYRISWFSKEGKAMGHKSIETYDFLYFKKFKQLSDDVLIQLSYVFTTSPSNIQFEADSLEETVINHENLLFLEESVREIESWLDNKTLINESMTLMISGAKYKSSVHELGSLCSRLTDDVLSPIAHKMPQDQQNYFRKNGVGFYETIVADGSYYVPHPEGPGGYGGTGIINVYISGFTSDVLKELVRGIFNHLRKWNIKWKNPKIESSKMYKSQVLRIPVISNPNKDTNLPELNLSNVNSYQIFHNVLQYEGENDFHMTAADLIQRIEVLAHDKGWISKNIIKPMDSDWPKAERDDQDTEENPHLRIANQIGDKLGGARMIMNGLNEDDIKFRLREIWKVAKWALDNGYTELSVG